MSSISIHKLSKQFDKVRALHDLNLQIDSGEFIALLGSSGCGKTTMLRCIAGLEQPTEGNIFFDGQDVTDVPTRLRPIGMVFQSYALFPNMTVRQNIAFPLTVRRQPPAQIRDRVEELITLVGLGGHADHFPNQLSGGQQQRTALARALAPAPAVLLLDEPLSALDAVVRLHLRDEIRRIQQTVKITALLVTHDQSEALAVADRVVVMSKGRIEQVASPAELYETPSTRFSANFIGNRNALELPVRGGRIQLGDALDLTAPQAMTDKALIFIRAEDIRLSEGGRGEPALVENRIFQGSSTRFYLSATIDGTDIRLRADWPSRMAADIKVGDVVRLHVDPADARVFPADDI